MALLHTGIFGFLFVISGFAYAVECPDGWVTYHSSCYLFARHHLVTFTEAVNYCQQRGGQLVKIESREENFFIRDLLRGMIAEDHWMGFTDEIAEGVWKWFPSDTVPTFTDWAPGEPNNEINEDCAMFKSSVDYRWDDRSCETKHEPICEIDSEGVIVIG